MITSRSRANCSDSSSSSSGTLNPDNGTSKADAIRPINNGRGVCKPFSSLIRCCRDVPVAAASLSCDKPRCFRAHLICSPKPALRGNPRGTLAAITSHTLRYVS